MIMAKYKNSDYDKVVGGVYFMEFDVYADTEEEIEVLAKMFGVQYEILAMEGPGGGNPAVNFWGDKQSMDKLLNHMEW